MAEPVAGDTPATGSAVLVLELPGTAREPGLRGCLWAARMGAGRFLDGIGRRRSERSGLDDGVGTLVTAVGALVAVAVIVGLAVRFGAPGLCWSGARTGGVRRCRQAPPRKGSARRNLEDLRFALAGAGDDGAA
jgi:hypothetical protein